MNEIPNILTERVDDLPLLAAQLRRMELPSLIDSYFVAHGNRGGLSLGWTATVWLTHILSQAERRLETLRGCTGQPVTVLDLTDDRLAAVLRTLADDAAWVAFERAVGRTLLRVYTLPSAPVRVDTTTASGYGQVTEDGLFQFG